ncbi:hypothetical protein BaRGS_00013555, partial [Batillaria attramentaria]
RTRPNTTKRKTSPKHQNQTVPPKAKENFKTKIFYAQLLDLTRTILPPEMPQLFAPMLRMMFCAVFLITMTSVIMSSSALSRHLSTSNSLCQHCNISELSYDTFRYRYLGACLVCGEFYGHEIEHC